MGFGPIRDLIAHAGVELKATAIVAQSVVPNGRSLICIGQGPTVRDGWMSALDHEHRSLTIGWLFPARAYAYARGSRIAYDYVITLSDGLEEPTMRTTYRYAYASAPTALATLAISALLAACANDAPRPLEPRSPAAMLREALASQQPDLGNCAYLSAPDGSTLVFHVYARGVQIYRWTGTSWQLYGPDAVLSADVEGKSIVGTHYVGPKWETSSGSIAEGTLIDRCTVDPNAVPWLSLSAKSTGAGVLQGVTFVQRVNTAGGKAPSTGGTVSGQEITVPYTAEYFFYR